MLNIVTTDDFAELRLGDGCYVDKTGFLEKFLMPYPMDVTLFTRPKRFGKTLFLSMLAEFFDIRRESRKLFAGLRVSVNEALCAQWMNRYPVLFLSLKDAGKPTYERALTDFQDIIAVYCTGHKYLLSSDRVEPADKALLQKYIDRVADEDDLGRALKTLTRVLAAHYGKPAIVLIDDYDAPVASASRYGYYDEMVGFLLGFLSRGLKTNWDNLEFAILTGNLHIPPKGDFGGFNYLEVDDIETTGRYADVFGFTRDEVDHLLCEKDLADKREDFAAWYGGYHFGDETDIFCPLGVMSFLEDLQVDADALPRGFWQDSAHALTQWLPHGKHAEIADGVAELLACNALVHEHRRPSYAPLEASSCWALLCSLGYLTRLSIEEAVARAFPSSAGGIWSPSPFPTGKSGNSSEKSSESGSGRLSERHRRMHFLRPSGRRITRVSGGSLRHGRAWRRTGARILPERLVFRPARSGFCWAFSFSPVQKVWPALKREQDSTSSGFWTTGEGLAQG